MTNNSVSIADQMADLEIQIEARYQAEFQRLQTQYDEHRRELHTTISRLNRLVGHLAHGAEIPDVIMTQGWGNDKARELSDDEFKALTGYLLSELKKAADFDTLLAAIKADESLLDIWENLCLMMRMREPV